MIHYNSCPLCGSTDLTESIKCTDHLVSGKEFGLAACSSCRLVFTQDIPEEAEIGSYYESQEYISHTDSGHTTLEKVYRLVRRFMLRRKRAMVKMATGLNTGKILDIGSGTGHFLNEMKSSGWEVKGIEINKTAREYSISKFGLEISDPESDNSLHDQIFDCITMWHVLEHFHHPDKYFENIKCFLKPGGSVIVALPNNESFDARFYRSSWAAYDVPRHLWHFNPETFSLFAEKNGFKVISKWSLPFDVYYISILSQKLRDSKLAALKGMLRATVFTVLSALNKTGRSSFVYLLKAR